MLSFQLPQPSSLTLETNIFHDNLLQHGASLFKTVENISVFHNMLFLSRYLKGETKPKKIECNSLTHETHHHVHKGTRGGLSVCAQLGGIENVIKKFN